MTRARLLAVLATATALSGAALTPLATSATAAGPLHMVRDGMAGRDTVTAPAPVQPDTTIEPSIAVDPADPMHAVAGYQMGRVDAGGDATNGFATTFNGGKSWVYGKVPGLTKVDGGTFDRASDAVIAFGPKHVVYYSSLVFMDSGTPANAAIVNSTSHDGGKHWDKWTLVNDDHGSGLNDKNWVIVDNGTGLGHHTGRVYVVWDQVYSTFAAYSDDEGKTWSQSFVVYSGLSIGATPLVLPNGDLAVVFDADVAPVPVVHPNIPEDQAEPISGISKIVVATAHGAGLVPTQGPLVFGPAVSVATYQNNAVRAQRAGTLPSAAVDAKTGRMYVTWEDARYRSDKANDAVISWSDDGVTWSSPIRINGGAKANNLDHYNPSVALTSDGAVHVMYRQRQESASVDGFSNYVDTFVQTSTNHGVSWSAPLKVNQVRSDVRFSAFSRGGAFHGDYNQIAASGKYVYVVRCESYSPRKGTKAEFPPAVHHQTTWVAVLSR
ncbi:MAG: hypothetical protein QOE64_657 [Frankiales bacterium]|nr:hypothetical protein [Frankiales bacterium]